MAGLSKGDADIVLRIATEMLDSDTAMKKAQKAAGIAGKRASQAFTSAYRQVMSDKKAFGAKMFELENILPKKQFDMVNAEFNRLGNTIQGKLMPRLKRLNLANKIVAKNMKGGFQSARGSILGLGLSMMFLGMAMKRIFDSIWKSSTKVFQDVAHSVEGTVTGFDMLNGSLDYLKFVMGQALEPAVQYLLPIIEKITEWVELNPQIAAGIVIILGVLGTFLMIAGQVGLAIFSIAAAWPSIVIAAKAAAAAVGAIFTPVGASIAAIALFLFMAWKTNLGGIVEFVKSTFGILLNLGKSLFGNFKEYFKGFFMVLKGLFTGDFKMIWNGVVKMVLNAITAAIKIVWGLGTAFMNVGTFILNTLKDIVFNAIKIMVGAIEVVTGWIDNIFGTNLSSAVGKAQSLISAFQKTVTIDYISSDMASAGDDIIEQIKNNIEVYVTLDGDEIANKTAEKINTTAESTT